MLKKDKTKEKNCLFFASDYHFEMISLPYINKSIKNNKEVIVISENNLENTINKLLLQVNLEDDEKDKILKIDWKNNDFDKFKEIKEADKEKRNTIVFIKGKENYIKNLFNSYKVNEIEASLFNNYRNKVTFHIFNSKLGFYNSNSNDLVEIDNCLLLDKDINNLIPKIKTLDLTNIKEIMIRKAVFNNEILMSFKGNINKEKLKEFGKENNITSLSLNDDVIYGKSYIKEIINNLEYTINKDSFFQVNTTCMIKLYDKVKEYAKKGNNLLDLYCGTGTIGMYLKDSYKYILGVEENSFAINSFNINKKINNIKNIDFKCMDASNIKIGDFDTVVVDPPRSGLSKKVINNLLNKKCKRIVYVSCNPKTLYKDIKLLEESYKVISLTPFNMFPKTKHIETVCLLEKE